MSQALWAGRIATKDEKKIKESNINGALALYPSLKQVINNSDNRLLTAIRIAIAGNVIDLGVGKEFNILEDMEKILIQEFAIFDFEEFKSQLEKAESIL